MVRKLKDTKENPKTDLVLGEDWITPTGDEDYDLRRKRSQRGTISINRSPLARKIITFNLLGLVILVAGVLYMNPFRDSLLLQRERGLVVEAELIADVFEAYLERESQLRQAVVVSPTPKITVADGAPISDAIEIAKPDFHPEEGVAYASAERAVTQEELLVAPEPPNFADALSNLNVPAGLGGFVFDENEELVASTIGLERPAPTSVDGYAPDRVSTLITDLLNGLWDLLSGLTPKDGSHSIPLDAEVMVRTLYPGAISGLTRVSNGVDENGSTVFSVATPILNNGKPAGVVAITSATGELDQLVRAEREQLLQMFVVAILVSIGLSLGTDTYSRSDSSS